MSEENVEIVRRLLDAWTRRDAQGAIELLHPDCEWHPALTAGGMEGTVYRGHDEIRSWFRGLDEAWSELTVQAADFRVVDEDRVLQLGHFHAVGRESGAVIDNPQALLCRFEGMRVAAAWGFANHQLALEAAGLSE